MTKDSFEFEFLLTFDPRESASAQATVALSFREERHTLVEFASFFQWLGERLDDGDIEFCNLIYDSMKLNKSSSRLIGLWLMRIIN